VGGEAVSPQSFLHPYTNCHPLNTQLSQLALQIYAMPKLLMIFLIS
jgi:hypothetical protein